MDVFLKTTLFIHVCSGFFAIASGFTALVSGKGNSLHRLAGKIFVGSMHIISVTAILIAGLKQNEFLLLIGVFAFFQNYSGYRAVKNKTLKPNMTDWTVLLIAACNCGLMIYSLTPVLMVFGGICVFLITGQFRIYLWTIRKREIPKLQWLRQHIGMMMGAYIATVTAFLVVNVRDFNPSWLPWLSPTFILTPLLLYWIKKFTSKTPENIL